MNRPPLACSPARPARRAFPMLCAVALWMLALPSPAAAAPPAPANPYVDLMDYPYEDAQRKAFQELRWRLVRNFDDVCGDTYCEGEYSDIQALRVRCSVLLASGTVSECRWAFAASDLSVDTRSGQVEARQPVWLCPLPVPPGTSVAAFLSALSGPRPLFRALPGTTESFYDALGDCLR